MMHDADLPIAREDAAQWNAASEQEKAMAYVGLQLNPVRPHTKVSNRLHSLNLWRNNVSFLAMRNTGVMMSAASKARAAAKTQTRLEKMANFAERYKDAGTVSPQAE